MTEAIKLITLLVESILKAVSGREWEKIQKASDILTTGTMKSRAAYLIARAKAESAFNAKKGGGK